MDSRATGPTRLGAPGAVDLRHTQTPLGSVLHGYGLTPAAARERAAVVRAVTADTRIRQRPMPVVITTGLIALAGLAVWAWLLYQAITDETPLPLLFWIALAVFLVAAAVCSWAWQLYDIRKAIVMWLAIVVLTVAAALIIAFVVVALKGSDSDMDLDIDLDGLLGRITGSGGTAAEFTGEVALPLVDGAASIMGDLAPEGVGAAAIAAAPPPDVGGRVGEPMTGPVCTACGRPLTPGLTICPGCGAAVGGV